MMELDPVAGSYDVILELLDENGRGQLFLEVNHDGGDLP